MKLLFTLLALSAQAAAQTIYTAPQPLFQTNISPAGQGNACAISANDQIVICTSADGSVTAIVPDSTTPAASGWIYTPSTSGTPSSTSGLTLSSNGSGEFLVYSVTVDGTGCMVEALTVATGAKLWSSELLNGACSGSPVVSGNGAYVFLTHNPADLTGIFTILTAADGTTFYQAADDAPMSPPGISFSPSTGFYTGGTGNTNDLVIFANAPFSGETSVTAGSAAFAFQFPIGFGGLTTGLGVVSLFNDTDWKATAPPLIAEGGLSMFWGVSRGSLLIWKDGRVFDRDVGGDRLSLGRGSPPSIPIPAEPAHNADYTTLYVPSAGTQFSAVDVTTIAEIWNITTVGPVYSQAMVSPDGASLIFIEQNGIVHAVNTADGSEIWTQAATPGSVLLSEFAMSAGGDKIYFVDSVGILYAWQIADAVPTAPAVAAPVAAPTAGGITTPPVTTPPAAIGVTTPPVTTPPVAIGSTIAPATAAPGTMMPVDTSNMTLVLDLILNVTPPLSNLTNLALSIGAETLLGSVDFGSTVFAPTDDAFAAVLGQPYIAELANGTEWNAHVGCLLTYHIATGFEMTTDMWMEGQEVPVQGGDAMVTLSAAPPAVNGIAISTADDVADNGVVQIIDSSILTPDCVTTNIYDLAANAGTFSTLLSLVDSAGLTSAISADRPLTVFAPTDAAFAALPAEVTAYLTDAANIDDLRTVLFYHVVRSNVVLKDDGTTVGSYPTTTDSGLTVDITYSNGTYSVNGGAISSTNLLAQNGVIQVTDSVLIPEGTGIPSAAPVTAPPVAPTGEASVSPVASESPVATEAPVADVTIPPAPAPTSSAFTTGVKSLVGVVIAAFFL